MSSGHSLRCLPGIGHRNPTRRVGRFAISPRLVSAHWYRPCRARDKAGPPAAGPGDRDVAVRRLRLRQRVQIAHQALEPLLQHMGVDLRGRDVGVAEQRLHDAQVGAVVQQVAGEGVAQHMRAHLLGAQAGGAGERLEVAGEMLAGEVPALAEGGEQPFRLGQRCRLGFHRRPACLLAGLRQQRPIVAHGALGGLVERHQAFLAALAAHDQHAGVALGRRRRQRHQLGDPQPGGIEHLDQAGEPQRPQRLGAGWPEIVAARAAASRRSTSAMLSTFGMRAAALGPLDDRGRIVAAAPFGIEEAVELADRGQPPRHRGGGKAAPASACR